MFLSADELRRLTGYCRPSAQARWLRRHARRCRDRAPEPVTLNGSLEISAGLGVRASIEQVTLELEQDRVDDDGTVYTHTISLAPHEARQIVDWLIEHVEAQ